MNNKMNVRETMFNDSVQKSINNERAADVN